MIIKSLTDYFSGESFRCEIVDPDDLPRGCDVIPAILDEETMERYEVYKNCVDKMYYAFIEED